MCKVLKIPRSSYYKYLNKVESKRSIQNKYLQHKILEIYNNTKKRYGSPKITKEPRNLGITISLNKTQRLMRKLGIKSVICKKFKPVSSRVKTENKENVFNRNFPTNSINEKWVTDITLTYIPRKMVAAI